MKIFWFFIEIRTISKNKIFEIFHEIFRYWDIFRKVISSPPKTIKIRTHHEFYVICVGTIVMKICIQHVLDFYWFFRTFPKNIYIYMLKIHLLKTKIKTENYVITMALIEHPPRLFCGKNSSFFVAA